MKILRRLSAASVIVALGTVMLGSWTRINGAGMTCPDWPLCHGMLIPSMADGTVWEWTHRLFAFCVAPLVVAVMIAAWRVRDRCAVRYADARRGRRALYRAVRSWRGDRTSFE